jgi:hypothetical protein
MEKFPCHSLKLSNNNENSKIEKKRRKKKKKDQFIVIDGNTNVSRPRFIGEFICNV